MVRTMNRLEVKVVLDVAKVILALAAILAWLS
jgi:hypothetical protein